MKHKAIIIGAGLLAAWAAQAQEDRQEQLSEVTITAPRIASSATPTAKPITVITREDIAQAPVQSLQDLLTYAANIDVAQRGGHGVQADISLRGGTFDQTAILLNGINLSNPHTGHYNLDLPVNLSDIERIEIIHGPAALLYGTGAFSGGINIITKHTPTPRLQATAQGGMHTLRTIEARAATNCRTTSHSLSVSHNASDGYMDNSDYTLYNALWQTRVHLPRAAKIELQAGYNDKKYGANTFYSAKYPQQYEQTGSYIGAVRGEWGGALKVSPVVYWQRHHDRFDLTKGSEEGRNYHRNDVYGARLIASYQSLLGNTRASGEWRKETIVSSVLGKVMEKPYGHYTHSDGRSTASLALEHSLALRHWLLSAGVLFDHNSLQADDYHCYPSVSLTYRTAERLKLSATWSKASRLPTFTDLYYTTLTHDGNEGLRPEKSESVEASAHYAAPFVQARLTAFLLWGRDMIDWVKSEQSDKWASWNLTEVNTQGIEASVRFPLGKALPFLGNRSALTLNYARLHQTTDTRGLISAYALNYLRDKLTAQLHHSLCKGLSAGWFFRFQKRMGTYEKYENGQKVSDEPFPAFTTLDLKLTYRCGNITFHADFNNLYDTRYFDKGNVPQAGFWLIAGIGYTLL